MTVVISDRHFRLRWQEVRILAGPLGFLFTGLLASLRRAPRRRFLDKINIENHNSK
jgi:hypothetical protein